MVEIEKSTRQSSLSAPGLKPNITQGSQAVEIEAGVWRLEIPQGPQGHYRLAQLDDYGSLPRGAFPWKAPFSLELKARASAEVIPGTWGFGLWNNPFGMAILRGAEILRLPALPNSAWFFFASPPNYLSLRDDLPAQGWLAATFRSPRWPAPFLALGSLALPLLALAPTARLLRRLGRRVVRQDAVRLTAGPTSWHAYRLDWQSSCVQFHVDGELVLETATAPQGPLGLVIWVDNQYAALTPEGRASFGTLASPEPAWIEIRDLLVNNQG
jgi:hypothetical protein